MRIIENNWEQKQKIRQIIEQILSKHWQKNIWKTFALKSIYYLLMLKHDEWNDIERFLCRKAPLCIKWEYTHKRALLDSNTYLLFLSKAYCARIIVSTVVWRTMHICYNVWYFCLKIYERFQMHAYNKYSILMSDT